MIARRLAVAIALAAGLSGCSSWNPLVSIGIMSEPANPPTPLGPVIHRANGKIYVYKFVGDGEYRAGEHGPASTTDRNMCRKRR